MRSWGSTGCDDLDEVIGGLIPGDNVVWVAEPGDRFDGIVTAFVDRGRQRHPTLVVALSPNDLAMPLPPGVERLDATPGSVWSSPHALADELDRRLIHEPGAHVVIDGFEGVVRRWGAERAMGFFARTCPSMLQYGSITLWRTTRQVGAVSLERLRQITQCFFEVRGDHLHLHKAEGRVGPVAGSVYEIHDGDGDMQLRLLPTHGRLAQGLASLRRDLGLTKAQLAELAGVTPSAISQAESTTRGLSLDTLLTLSDRLGVSLDRLVGGRPDPGYRLARFDRHRPTVADGVVTLADDPSLGLRALFVTLAGHHESAAPVPHKGTELVAVARGLVQVHVGEDTPVLRAGDTLLATSARITRWRNLRPDAASFYWILRD